MVNAGNISLKLSGGEWMVVNDQERQELYHEI